MQKQLRTEERKEKQKRAHKIKDTEKGGKRNYKKTDVEKRNKNMKKLKQGTKNEILKVTKKE